MKMIQKNKLEKILLRAKEDLSIWLHYANVNTLEEFTTKSEEIKNKSYHVYTDVVKHIQYISKIEATIGKL